VTWGRSNERGEQSKSSVSAVLASLKRGPTVRGQKPGYRRERWRDGENVPRAGTILAKKPGQERSGGIVGKVGD